MTEIEHRGAEREASPVIGANITKPLQREQQAARSSAADASGGRGFGDGQCRSLCAEGANDRKPSVQGPHDVDPSLCTGLLRPDLTLWQGDL